MTRIDCAACRNWLPGSACDTTRPIITSSEHFNLSQADYGVCELEPPKPMVGPSGDMTFTQPITHRSRSCSMAEPLPDYEEAGPDGPGEGEPHPNVAKLDVSFRIREAA